MKHPSLAATYATRALRVHPTIYGMAITCTCSSIASSSSVLCYTVYCICSNIPMSDHVGCIALCIMHYTVCITRTAAAAASVTVQQYPYGRLYRCIALCSSTRTVVHPTTCKLYSTTSTYHSHIQLLWPHA